MATLLSGDLATSVVNMLLIVFYAVLMWQYDTRADARRHRIAVANLLVLRYIARRNIDLNLKLQQARPASRACRFRACRSSRR